MGSFQWTLEPQVPAADVIIVASFFAWLQSAQYINGNPWPLINLKTGDDQSERMLDTMALSESAMSESSNMLKPKRPPLPAIEFCSS